MPSEVKVNNKLRKISAGLILSGTLLLLGACYLLFLSFGPLIQLESRYILANFSEVEKDPDSLARETFLNELGISDNTELDNFMLFIPKIEARSRVVSNVDASKSSVYLEALNKGIAHAAGSALPGVAGNTFLFAHSGRNFYEDSEQNVQFYLLDKMSPGDVIYIKYLDKLHKYSVTETKKVWPSETEYLTIQDYELNRLTLMSCWPAGIDYQRQLVIAEPLEVVPF